MCSLITCMNLLFHKILLIFIIFRQELSLFSFLSFLNYKYSITHRLPLTLNCVYPDCTQVSEFLLWKILQTSVGPYGARELCIVVSTVTVYRPRF